MTHVLSDSFKMYLRDTTTPIVLAGFCYNVDKLVKVSHFSVFPFELDFFLSNFNVRAEFTKVSFYALIPPDIGNHFSTIHIVTIYR